MSEVDTDAFHQDRSIYVSVNCSFWDGFAGVCILDNGKVICPHCSSPLTKAYPNEQELFKSDLFKRNRSFHLFSRGKCFKTEGEAKIELRKALHIGQRVEYDHRLLVYQLRMFDFPFPRTVA